MSADICSRFNLSPLALLAVEIATIQEVFNISGNSQFKAYWINIKKLENY